MLPESQPRTKSRDGCSSEEAELSIGDWIGRTESRNDTVTAAPLAALSATLDRNDPTPETGDAVPLLWHWLYFLPRTRQSELGADGHARLGDFLPPVGNGRRMYAGGRVCVHGPLRVGDHVERVSRIASISEKVGRKGSLLFVKVQHEIRTSGALALVEDHDIVYVGADEGRPADRAGATESQTKARSSEVSKLSAPSDPSQSTAGAGPVALWRRQLCPDDVLLFRYSALTFNGYRIHYDRRFSTEVQGYPGLVVHAPLLATLLADLLRRNLPEAAVSTFTFRAQRPLFDGMSISFCGHPDPDGRTVSLWVEGEDGGVAFEATATLGD
jgi:3-methylfumaryl-CoA hydratase